MTLDIFLKNRIPYKLFFSIVVFCSVNTEALSAEDGAQVPDNGHTIIIESGNSSYFNSLLYKVWGRLRALNSQYTTGREPGDAVAIIGIRGARIATANTKPEDNTADNLDNNAELAQFIRAQRYAESGQLEQAISEFGVFIDNYTDSELRPNALFAIGVSQASLGENESSKWTFVDFLGEYPAHPLTADAGRILEEFEIIELLGD
jgi:TolA-binding protein